MRREYYKPIPFMKVNLKKNHQSASKLNVITYEKDDASRLT